jgi:FdhE protein
MVEIQDIESRFDRLVQARPDLAEAASLQRELLREALRVTPAARPPLLPRQRGLQKLEQGVPLLHDEAFEADLATCRDLFGRLLNVLQLRPASAEAAAELAQAAASGRLDFEHAIGEALANHLDHLQDLAVWLSVQPDVLATVLELTVRPSLQVMGAALAPLLNEEARWQRGYCPICGAWPILAELQMTEQRRHLRCFRCGSDWPTLRLLCPYCGNDDHATLGYLQGERELRYRVETCERCKGYLKSVNAFDSSPPAVLVLDDLASVHLDIAALERGYQRPDEAGFRLELSVGEQDEALESLLEGVD